MSDAEWAVIEPLLPGPGWQRGQGGSPGKYCRRDIVNGIRYLTHNGPAGRAMPADLPYRRTVYHYVRAWQARSSSAPVACTHSTSCPQVGSRENLRLDHETPPVRRDYERLLDHHETYIYWSMIHIRAARLVRRHAPAPIAPAPATAILLPPYEVVKGTKPVTV